MNEMTGENVVLDLVLIPIIVFLRFVLWFGIGGIIQAVYGDPIVLVGGIELPWLMAITALMLTTTTGNKND